MSNGQVPPLPGSRRHAAIGARIVVLRVVDILLVTERQREVQVALYAGPSRVSRGKDAPDYFVRTPSFHVSASPRHHNRLSTAQQHAADGQPRKPSHVRLGWRRRMCPLASETVRARASVARAYTCAATRAFACEAARATALRQHTRKSARFRLRALPAVGRVSDSLYVRGRESVCVRGCTSGNDRVCAHVRARVSVFEAA